MCSLTFPFKTLSILASAYLLGISIVSATVLPTVLPSGHDAQTDPSPMVIQDAWPAMADSFTLSGELTVNRAGQDSNLIHIPGVGLLALRGDQLHLVAQLNPHNRSETVVVDGVKTDGTPQHFEAKVQTSGRITLTVGDRTNFGYNPAWRTLAMLDQSGEVVLAQSGAYAGKMSEISLVFKAEKDPRLTMAPEEMASEKMPKLELVEEFGDTNIYIDGRWLVHLRQNQFLLMRSNVTNDRWIGTDRAPMNLAWNYALPSKDLAGKVLKTELLPDGFRLTLSAHKAKAADVLHESVLTATWLPQKKAFAYELRKKLGGNLKSWIAIDPWAKGAAARGSKSKLEIVDYHVGRISNMDRIVNDDYNRPDLYEGVYFTPDGNEWVWYPKLPIPRTMRQFPGRGFDGYVYDYEIGEEGSFAMLDVNEGGWIMKMPELSGGRRLIDICWSWYDVHVVMLDALQVVDAPEQFEVSATLRFIPLTPTEAKRIIDDAKEVDWKDRPEYQLPVVYLDGRLNDFETQIGGVTGGRDWVDPMMASTPDCIWDRAVGYKSPSSLKISHDESGDLSAWFSYLWGFPGTEFITVGKRARLTGMVKTKDLEGRAMLCMGVGILETKNVLFPAADQPNYVVGPVFTGTQDWTPVAIDFTVSKDGAPNQIVFVQEGKGEVWLDDVTIELLD